MLLPRYRKFTGGVF